MELQKIDPLSDSRWSDLVESHNNASAFHDAGWLRALSLTYGYKPVVLTSASSNEALTDGIAFCEVVSRLTGKRLVSLPFSDHCEPLSCREWDFSELLTWMTAECEREHWKYLEFRPLTWNAEPSGLPASESYWFHSLDLDRSLGQIFDSFHKDSMQRRIRRAERAQLEYERGQSDRLVTEFYQLMTATRRRHSLPPQPREWFKNLARCMGQKLTIRAVRKGELPIAAILTLSHRDQVIYKYGASESRFHHLAGMPFLFWNLIQESKANGVVRLDLGRTDTDQEGLIAFKDRLGADRKLISYSRYPAQAGRKLAAKRFSAARFLFSALPDSVSSWTGRLIYRHLG